MIYYYFHLYVRIIIRRNLLFVYNKYYKSFIGNIIRRICISPWGKNLLGGESISYFIDSMIIVLSSKLVGYNLIAISYSKSDSGLGFDFGF